MQPPSLPPRKLLKTLGDDNYLFEIDNTSLEGFLACDRAAFFNLVLGRTGIKGAAITYGKAIHRALELHYKDQADLPTQLQAGNEILSTLPYNPSEWRGPESFQKAIEGYHKKYPSEPFSLIQLDSTPAVEQAFTYHLGEIKVDKTLVFSAEQIVADCNDPKPLYINTLQICWTGVIDLLVQQQNHIWVIDHKTSSVVGPTYFQGFELSQQFTGYVWAASKILGQRVSGALLNVIAGRKPTKTGTSLEFFRQYFPYADWQLAEWENDIMTLVADFVHRLTTNNFPKKTLWCINKFGVCPYHDVCKLSPDLRPTLLNSNQFETNVWNPLT